jgi:hypothetical protein
LPLCIFLGRCVVVKFSTFFLLHTFFLAFFNSKVLFIYLFKVIFFSFSHFFLMFFNIFLS